MVRKNTGSSLSSSLVLVLVLFVRSDAALPRQLGTTPPAAADVVVVGKEEDAKSDYREMKNLPPFPFSFPDMPFTPPLQLPPLTFTPPFGVPSGPPFAGFPLPPFPFPPIPFLSSLSSLLLLSKNPSV
ncbi:cyclin-dependent kinase 12-like [Hibiscus syriacus]|uniref:cyclin-dependent kinase 12-like n=1 Tax=Hibiscus syriacus TaxID=106335 RepID=UPI0019218ACA|nr:cyclin-dependent kinase 12-like [Hibiscus syriacus]